MTDGMTRHQCCRKDEIVGGIESCFLYVILFLWLNFESFRRFDH